MAAESISNPFECVINPSSLSTEDVIDRFQDFGLLWVRLAQPSSSSTAAEATLEALSKHSAACQENWTVENLGTVESEGDLTPTSLASKSDSSFYVSTILHKDQEAALTALTTTCQKYCDAQSLARDLHCNGGAWIFVGRHHTANDPSAKKRKRPLAGRAEHVDDVAHSGTYHYQVAGSKRWFLKPHADLVLPGDGKVQALLGDDGRLEIHVQQGDWFLLNTKLWYHRTELPDDKEWSISLARDFYLPLPCPRNVLSGEIIFEENEIPDEIPSSSDLANCALAEAEDANGDAVIVMIAIADINHGELMYVASEENEYNADEVVDPRAVVKKAFDAGNVVLVGPDIPQELPRSLEPSCELLDGNIVKALQPMKPGEVISILPDDMEDYQEVEVDLATGEIHRSKL